jgi:hypothetical protein
MSMTLGQLFVAACLSLFISISTAEEAGLKEAELSELMEFQTWRFHATGPELTARLGWEISLFAQTWEGKSVGKVYMGDVKTGSDLVVVVQNADDIHRDVNVYAKHDNWATKYPVTRLDLDMDATELLRQVPIHSVVLKQPIWYEDILVLYYRPDVAWDWANDGKPPAFDAKKHVFLGLKFTKVPKEK